MDSLDFVVNELKKGLREEAEKIKREVRPFFCWGSIWW